ncbi:hypothetical protein [Kitasatospora griseola]|uniref:hypothetical protein n=1 Tax=Kitasatospora griseola TaxID=2064 RepID=UPI00364B5ED5
MFDREALLEIGVRPVMYLSNAEMDLTSSLPDKSRNRRVRYEPGTADWLHEREWRLCFTKETAQSDEAHLTITKDLTIGVIVGEQGWHPPTRHYRRNISLPKLPLGVSAFGYATHMVRGRSGWPEALVVERTRPGRRRRLRDRRADADRGGIRRGVRRQLQVGAEVLASPGILVRIGL